MDLGRLATGSVDFPVDSDPTLRFFPGNIEGCPDDAMAPETCCDAEIFSLSGDVTGDWLAETVLGAPARLWLGLVFAISFASWSSSLSESSSGNESMSS